MANLDIRGIGQKSIDFEIIEEYLVNIQRELNIHRLRSRWINIKFTKNVDDAMGDCIGDTSDVDIRIDKTMSWEDKMITLAHEMVHAEQMLRGKFTDGFFWKNRNYEKCEYERQPWEMSAHQLEKKLYKKCYPEWAKEYSNT